MGCPSHREVAPSKPHKDRKGFVLDASFVAFSTVMLLLLVSIVRVWYLGDKLGAAEREASRLQVSHLSF